MQQQEEDKEEKMEHSELKQNEVKTKSDNRRYLDKVDAKHKHRFRTRNIIIGVALGCIIVVAIELVISGFL